MLLAHFCMGFTFRLAYFSEVQFPTYYVSADPMKQNLPQQLLELVTISLWFYCLWIFLDLALLLSHADLWVYCFWASSGDVVQVNVRCCLWQIMSMLYKAFNLFIIKMIIYSHLFSAIYFFIPTFFFLSIHFFFLLLFFLILGNTSLLVINSFSIFC